MRTDGADFQRATRWLFMRTSRHHTTRVQMGPIFSFFVGYTATGLELDSEYFRLAEKAIPRLAALYPEFKGQAIDVELNGSVERDEPEAQLALVLAETPPAYKSSTRNRKPAVRS